MQAECHLKACSQTRIHGNIGRFTVLGSFLRSGVPTTNQEEAWFRFGGKVGHFLCGQDFGPQFGSSLTGEVSRENLNQFSLLGIHMP